MTQPLFGFSADISLVSSCGCGPHIVLNVNIFGRISKTQTCTAGTVDGHKDTRGVQSSLRFEHNTEAIEDSKTLASSTSRDLPVYIL
ncbi:hypothetical protein EON65_47850 [archaeon]|nr:MAG: hypothetical protein EON65_47850 [archaeon]